MCGMEKGYSSRSVVFFALSANLFIALMKLIVALITRSSAMMAETIHSFADTFNQVFLLIGIRKGKKEPDSLHPFGYSGELYFWSFVVAIMLFTMGAVFSIYEGIHKLLHPQVIEGIHFAYLVLVLSLVAELVAFRRAYKKIEREKEGMKLWQYLRLTKSSELIVVFLEDLAAVAGLTTALIFLFVEQMTGILVFDGIASIVIGLILGLVALFLGRETRSLLLGESASPELIQKISDILAKEESIDKVIFLKSLQLGPEDILLAGKVEFNHRLTMVEISNLINGLEKEIRGKFPHVKRIYLEPDILRTS